MNDHPASFGRQAVLATNPATLLALEERAGHSDRFVDIDALADSLLRRSLSAEQVAVLTSQNRQLSLAIPGLDLAQRAFVAREFVLEEQQARGAWFLPEEATLDVGWANFPLHFQNEPRFATGITTAQRGKIRFRDSPDGFFFWSVLEPLFEHLYYPFALRGPLAGTKDRDWQRNAWRGAEVFFEAIGFDVDEALAPMRYGGGWSKLRAHEQVQAKQALMHTLRDQAERPRAALFRAYQIQRLISRYYRQAKKDPPKLRQVLTRELQPILAGFFGGDWLALLTYLGEEPHPDERIATALPETRLVVGDRDRVAAVAAAQGLPTAEIERVLAAFWGSDKASSPIEERVAVLQDYWQEFDAIHERQHPGMRPLWGLVEEGGINLRAQEPYQPGLYRAILTSDILSNVDRLWGTCMLARWPDRLLSSIAPHTLMAEAFGPALKFWHGCALTAWFLTEGPYSRTSFLDLPDYYARELAALGQLGCPIDPALFDQCRRADSQLGPQRSIFDPDSTSRHEIGGGFSLTMEMSIGSRRDDFEILRDIISRHRRAWSEQYLTTYLRTRWETEIRDAARDFSLLSERKGKAPNPKQFATHAIEATNHWFGGDISGLYRMMGEKSPFEPKRHQIMPEDREAFARSVYERLVNASAALASSTTGAPTRDEMYQSQSLWNLQWMAEESLRFLQREEAIGRSPTLEEFGREGFVYRAAALSNGVDFAWSAYQEAIRATQLSLTKPSNYPEMAVPRSETRNNRERDATQNLNPQPKRKPFWRRIFGLDQ